MTSPLLFSNRFLPKEYDVHFTITDKKNFQAKVFIPLMENPRWTSTSTPVTFQLALNTQSLISLSAFVNTKQGKEKVQISLQKESNTTTYSHQTVDLVESIEITYLGSIDTILTYEDSTKGLFKTQYMDPNTGRQELCIWSTHTQPNHASRLLPCLDEISFKVPIQLTLTVGTKYETVSNTKIENVNVESGMKTVVFEKTPPMSLAVFAFTFGDLEYLEHTNSRVPLRLFTQVGESHRGRFALNTAIETLETITFLFNLPFPLAKLDFVALPFLMDGGVENWGCISVINDGILTPGWQVSQTTLSRVEKQIQDIIVHQFVHMFMGDFITIDHWQYEWFNESFATFMANEILGRWDDLSGDELLQLKLSQMNYDVDVVQGHLKSTPDSINETFTRSAYEKGIWLIKLVMSLFETSNDFFKAIGDFISTREFGTFKPHDLWVYLKSHEANKLQYDIPTICHSWTHLPGLPIITVTRTTEGVKLEQHQCVFEKLEDIEDVPFQIPLLVKTSDGKLGRQLMTDRSLLIAEDVLIIECDLAVINYPSDQYKLIASKFNILTSVEQKHLISDLNVLLGSPYQSDAHIVAILDLLKAVKNISKMDQWSMDSLLTNFIQLTKQTPHLSKLSNELTTKFIQQYQWEKPVESTGIDVRSTILSLHLDNSHLQTLAKRLFKMLLHGPKNSVPKEFLVPLLALVAHTATLKEFKDLTAIVKTPNTVTSNTWTKSTVSQLASSKDVQLSALNALGCVQDPQLIAKTLNFVSSNVEFPMIEMALMNLTCYSELWSWWSKNELVWWSKWNANHLSSIGRFFENVTKYLMELAQRVGGQFQTDIENWAFKKSNNGDKRMQHWLLEAKDKPKQIELIINDEVLSQF